MKLRQDIERPGPKILRPKASEPRTYQRSTDRSVAAHRQALRRAVRYRGAIRGVENDQTLRERNRATAHGVN